MEPLEAQRDIPDMGRDLWNRSYYPTGPDAAALHKDWFIVDATGQTLGRPATVAGDCTLMTLSVHMLSMQCATIPASCRRIKCCTCCAASGRVAAAAAG